MLTAYLVTVASILGSMHHQVVELNNFIVALLNQRGLVHSSVLT